MTIRLPPVVRSEALQTIDPSQTPILQGFPSACARNNSEPSEIGGFATLSATFRTAYRNVSPRIVFYSGIMFLRGTRIPCLRIDGIAKHAPVAADIYTFEKEILYRRSWAPKAQSLEEYFLFLCCPLPSQSNWLYLDRRFIDRFPTCISHLF